ncbi:MAG: hypothetical protein VCD00_13625 [Candidatus Hydrogenedentota bacterium]
MVATDKKSRWKTSLLDDKRVVHYWDEEKVLGIWIEEHVSTKHLGPIDWDSFYLFDGDGVWADDFEGLKASGTPVIAETESLQKGIQDLFGADSD